MAKPEETIWIVTVSYRLSDGSYTDFLKAGLNVNQLPVLSDAIADLQTRLEEIPPQKFKHLNETLVSADGGRILTVNGERIQVKAGEPFGFYLQDFQIQSVTFEAGSVVAKVQIVATVVSTTVGTLAGYPLAKDGFAELRTDIIEIVEHSFGVVDETLDAVATAVIDESPAPADNSELKYYFVAPNRFEQEVLNRALKLP